MTRTYTSKKSGRRMYCINLAVEVDMLDKIKELAELKYKIPWNRSQVLRMIIEEGWQKWRMGEGRGVRKEKKEDDRTET